MCLRARARASARVRVWELEAMGGDDCVIKEKSGLELRLLSSLWQG